MNNLSYNPTYHNLDTKTMTQNDQQNMYFSYQRVSSERQTEGMSLEEQTRQIRSFAEKKELIIKQEYVEVDSASELNRPVFAEMVTELKKQRLTGIIFHSVDRSARNPFDQATIYKLIQEGYTFHFVAENLSTDNPTARSMILIMWGMASSFTENLKFHVNKGIMGMLNDGRSPNAGPIGYLDKGKGVKEPDPIQSRLVRRAFEMYATEEYDIITLANKLNDLGLRNKQGNPVPYKVLYKMFRNQFYIGTITYRDIPYEGKHEKIIPKSLFDKVQLALNKKSYKHKTRFAYIFQHLVNCPKCGRRLRCISAKKWYKYYNCRHKDCSYKENISESQLEAAFLDALRKIEFTDKEVEMFLKAVVQFRQDLRATSKLQVRQLEMEAAKIDQQIDDLMTKYLEQKLTDDDYKAMKGKLINKRQELSERNTSLSKADEDICQKIEEIGKLMKKPVNAYFLADNENKRRLVRSLMENFIWEEEKPIVNWRNIIKHLSEKDKCLIGSAPQSRTIPSGVSKGVPRHSFLSSTTHQGLGMKFKIRQMRQYKRIR